jgi:primosomal protein N' (replication factor Y) (superfamily II helicase)
MFRFALTGQCAAAQKHFMTASPDTPPETVRVLLPVPALGVLDYAAGPQLIPPGSLVEVPLGPRRLTGVVWDASARSAKPVAASKLKPVSQVLATPPMRKPLRDLIGWVSDYYLSPLGAVLRMALPGSAAGAPSRVQRQYRVTGNVPPGLSPRRAQALATLSGLQGSQTELARQAAVSPAVLKALIEAGALEAVEVSVDGPFKNPDPDHASVMLSDDQQAAADQLCKALTARTSKPVLLEGVTGSGKTEVYFEAVAQALKNQAQVLVLLPEIAMTRQWFTRFRARFGVDPVEWHSDQSPPYRRRAWREIAEGRARVIVGARSALFLPFARLQLIVVDEEHESSFKQEDGVSYHARDIAVVRAHFEKCCIVLASATPSLESRTNAKTGKYTYLTLPSRFGGAQLPDVTLIDLRKDPPPRSRWIAPALLDDLSKTLARGEQALLFLNRRGYAPVTLCRRCGERVTCPQCSAWLVEHKLTSKLQCHHCGFATPIPRTCTSCSAEDSLVPCGPGVERIAEEIAQVLPDARAVLVTSDTIGSPARAAALVESVENGSINVLIGTQLATKGHHFPNLTCVGIIDADLGLNGGDLRAAERTFQQIVQASGRAGRAEKPGRVWVQTYQPETALMRALQRADVAGFYAAESAARERTGVPPFGRYAAVIVAGQNLPQVQEAARTLGKCAPGAPGIAVLGPAPAPLAMLRGQHRMRLLLHVSRNVNIQSVLRAWLHAASWPTGVRVMVDVDPYSFL